MTDAPSVVLPWALAADAEASPRLLLKGQLRLAAISELDPTNDRAQLIREQARTTIGWMTD